MKLYLIELFPLSDQGEGPYGDPDPEACYLRFKPNYRPGHEMPLGQAYREDAALFSDPQALFKLAMIETDCNWATGHGGIAYAGFKIHQIDLVPDRKVFSRQEVEDYLRANAKLKAEWAARKNSLN